MQVAHDIETRKAATDVPRPRSSDHVQRIQPAGVREAAHNGKTLAVMAEQSSKLSSGNPSELFRHFLTDQLTHDDTTASHAAGLGNVRRAS